MEGDRRLRSHRSRLPVGSRLLQFICEPLSIMRLSLGLRLEALHYELHLTVGFRLETSSGLSVSSVGLLRQALFKHRNLMLYGHFMGVPCSKRIGRDTHLVCVDRSLSAGLDRTDGSR